MEVFNIICLIFYGIFRMFLNNLDYLIKYIGYIFDFISLGSLLSVGMMIFAILFILKINLNEQNK